MKCWPPNRPTKTASCISKWGLTRGEGGQAPAAIVAADKSDYAFLSLKTTAFDLSDRGVAGRQVPTGLDAFVYTERGVYRSGETVHVTSLLRDARGIAAASPLTLVMERPDGVEYRRALVADQGLGGHSWSVPIVSSASTGTWRVRAYTDPKRPPVGEATFLVEDYVADRIEFDLTTAAKVIPRDAPAQLSVDGHFLYGAPASDLDLSGAVTIAAAKERPGFAGYSFGLADDEVTAVRQDLEDMPATDATGKASFPVKLDKIPATSRPLEATVTVSMAESGGRAVERKITLPIAPDAAMIGVKPAFSGRSLADGANADFDVVMAAPDGKTLAQGGLHYELLRVETSYQWYRQNGSWEYEPVKRTERVANGTVDVTADKPARLSMPVKWGRYRLEVSTGTPNGAVTSLTFDAGFYAEANADTPDLLEVALDKSDYKSGDAMTVSVTARTAGRLTLNTFTDRLVASTSQDVKAGSVRVPLTVGRDWGTGAYMVATLRRPLDAPAQRMPGRAIGVQWFSIDRAARTFGARHEAAGHHAAEFRAQRADQARRTWRRRGGARRCRRRRCRHSQSHQLQAAGARYLLSRPAPAHRRNPRSLRAIDRRHAGRARGDPLGRRQRRRIDRLAADAGAAGALFRHRDRSALTAPRR